MILNSFPTLALVPFLSPNWQQFYCREFFPRQSYCLFYPLVLSSYPGFFLLPQIIFALLLQLVLSDAFMVCNLLTSQLLVPLTVQHVLSSLLSFKGKPLLSHKLSYPLAELNLWWPLFPLLYLFMPNFTSVFTVATSESFAIGSVILLSTSCKTFLLSFQPQNMNRYLTVWVFAFFLGFNATNSDGELLFICHVLMVRCRFVIWWKNGSNGWEIAYDPVTLQ